MTREISASVGINGINHADDVVTVQKLLNNVPEMNGGPKVKLKIDGICGPKTKSAIQAFQLKHFGWSGADGRVDPGKQTLAKLNEYDQSTPVITSQRFRIRRNWDMKIISNKHEDWFWYFEVVDVNTQQAAYYYFGDRNRPKMKPHAFVGAWHSFSTAKPYSVEGLECSASYSTYTFNDVEPVNNLHLKLVPTPAIITGFASQLFFPEEGPEKKTFDLWGDFILLKPTP